MLSYIKTTRQDVLGSDGAEIKAQFLKVQEAYDSRIVFAEFQSAYFKKNSGEQPL